MGEITYLTKAASKGDSLRATVPMSIIKQCGGDFSHEEKF
jgi:hypothetical protein